MSDLVNDKQLSCRECGGTDIHRIAKTPFQRTLNLFIEVNHYSCSDCQHRDFRVISRKPKVGVLVLLGLIAILLITSINPIGRLSPKDLSDDQIVQVDDPIVYTGEKEQDELDQPDDNLANIEQDENLAAIKDALATSHEVKPDSQIDQVPGSENIVPQLQPDAITAGTEQSDVIEIDGPITSVSAQPSPDPGELTEAQKIQIETVVNIEATVLAESAIDTVLSKSTESKETIGTVTPASSSSSINVAVQTESPDENLKGGGKETILSLNPDYFTVQIASSPTEAAALSLIEQVQSSVSSQPLYYYLSLKQDIQWYPVLLGYFNSLAEATQATQSLPEWIRRKDPFTRRVSVIQKSIRGEY